MKSFLVTLTMFLSLAHAGDRTSAYDAICKPMTFETDRKNCMAKIKHYNYFDDRGLGVCAALTFDTNKLSCLEMIGDKTYERYEMDYCISQTFESEKLACLRENGTAYNPNRCPCVSREEAISQLSGSLYDLRNGNLRNADQRISYLLGRFTDCN